MLKIIQRNLFRTSCSRVVFQCSRKQSSVITQQNNSEIVKSNPLEHYDYFGVNQLFSVKHLFDNRMHLGHVASSLTQEMAPFVYGTRLVLLKLISNYIIINNTQ